VSVDASFAAWAILGAAVVVMLVVDLFVFAQGKREVTLKESAIWSVVWLALALAFTTVMWAYGGGDAGSEYLAGYLIERSLSLDNLFVFAVLFSYFGVPRIQQGRLLSWGIALALVLRLIFILLGAALLDAFHITFYFFGALLIYTAYRLARHDDTAADPERNPAIRLVRGLGAKGDKAAVIAVFAAVAITDVIFAIDSIPAIFAITTVPFIVFAANAFAMLGLRALYFLLVGVMDRFVYLSQGLSVILAVIGVKMLLIDVWHVPIWLSLALIVVILAATAVLSLRAAPEGAPQADRA
jgi:tellurite resistance protein TerC